MNLKVYVFTNKNDAFLYDHGRLARKSIFQFIWDSQQLHGLNPKETLILKRIYPIKKSPSEENKLQEIQRFIDERQLNVINL